MLARLDCVEALGPPLAGTCIGATSCPSLLSPTLWARGHQYTRPTVKETNPPPVAEELSLLTEDEPSLMSEDR